MFKPTPFIVDHDRFYYEPRVLWSVGQVGNTVTPRSSLQPKGFLELDRNHYQNGGKYPIRITHAIVSPVGYLYRDMQASYPDPTTYDQCMAALGRIRLRISFPRRSFVDPIDTDALSFANVATAEPSMANDPVAARRTASGLYGVSRWGFEPPLMVPQKATLNLELSSIQTYQDLDHVPVNASMAFFERGGRMLGHARTRARQLVPTGDTFVDYAWPRTHAPVIGDVNAGKNGVKGSTTQGFPPQGKWASNVYNHQLANRGLPYTEVTGFAVAIDQTAMDDAARASMILAGGTLAPISQRIVTKAKTRDAGTQQPWWRDGAPLSLVTPSLNNAACVHRWDQPFELGPGEYMRVTLQAPPTWSVPVTEAPPVDIDPIYNVGVSFLGYAVVEDNNVKHYR